jgi:peptidoglycan-associated lipoprotein
VETNMKKFSNAILMTLVVALLVLAPACRSTKKPKMVEQPTQTNTVVPEVADVRPTDTAERVEQPDDFVKTDTPREEVFPADIEELNRFVQRKGYIRDAFYNYDEATLDDAAQSALGSSATWLKASEGGSYNLLVEGHCDERGTEQYNLALGDKRANTVKEYLVTLGVDSSRIRTVSYGEERPFDPGHDDDAFAKNRRAHLVLVGK